MTARPAAKCLAATVLNPDVGKGSIPPVFDIKLMCNANTDHRGRAEDVVLSSKRANRGVWLLPDVLTVRF
jgi:hypothetical protein